MCEFKKKKLSTENKNFDFFYISDFIGHYYGDVKFAPGILSLKL